ncbi:MAG: hypothetical protein B6U77_02560 [Candidatus Hecatellales archaeon ex4484_218]|nr:MAG: hypothetical protein B6U77_02560 [Candidatus Hecatellales archaeon ex4484_218]
MKRRDDLLVTLKDKVVEAIKAGKKDEAITLVQELYEKFKPLHDRYCDWINLLFVYIAKKLGEEAVKDATEMLVTKIYPPMFEQLKKLSYEQLVNAVVELHKAHYSKFYVVEDEEKTVIVVTGCNSGGGRILRDGLPQLPRKEGLTKKAWPWSFNKEGFPYYCVHAYFFNKLFKQLGLNIEVQWGKMYDEKGNPIDESCKYVIYKK